MALSGRWNLRLSRVREGKMFMTLERGPVISSFSSIMVPEVGRPFQSCKTEPFISLPMHSR